MSRSPINVISVLPSRTASVWLHRFAWMTCLATFPLIFMGGLVTSHAAGMSVPDWPNSYGYNMFLFPPSKWVGGIFYEHTHRLMGTVVGFCAILLASFACAPARTMKGRRIIVGLAVSLEAINAIGTAAMLIFPDAFRLPVAARNAAAIIPQGAVTAVGIALVGTIAWFSRAPEPRRWVRWLSLTTLLAVCIQGLLGGLRVDLINLTLAIIHGCFAQAFFCLTVLMVLVTSPKWERRETLLPTRGLAVMSLTTLLAVYSQLIVGAIMRHQGAGLAIPDIPFAYGHWLPPISRDALAAANQQRAWQYHLDPITLRQIWLHFGHRLGAMVVTVAAIVLIAMILKNHRRQPRLARPAMTLGVLLLTQITLGLLTVYMRKPADVASTHVAVGALVLVTTFVIAARTTQMRQIVGVSRLPKATKRSAVSNEPNLVTA